MTKERLRQLSWLKLEIEDLEARIQKIENALAGRAARIDGMRWLGGRNDLVGDLVPQLSELQDCLVKCRSAAIAEYNALQQCIAEIADSQIRVIFSLRYMDCLSWHQIAWRIGGNTADSVRMIHNRYLARQQGD